MYREAFGPLYLNEDEIEGPTFPRSQVAEMEDAQRILERCLGRAQRGLAGTGAHLNDDITRDNLVLRAARERLTERIGRLDLAIESGRNMATLEGEPIELEGWPALQRSATNLAHNVRDGVCWGRSTLSKAQLRRDALLMVAGALEERERTNRFLHREGID